MKKQLRNLFAVLIAMAMLLALAGCGGGAESAPPPPSESGAAPAESAPADAEGENEGAGQNVKIPQEELDAFCAKTADEIIQEYLGADPAASTHEQRMEFIRAQRYSWLDDYTDHFDMELPEAYEEALDILEEQGVELPTPQETLLAYADSEYPTLRMAVFRRMVLADWDEETLALAKERIQKEDVYFVLGYMISALDDESSDPEIANFILDMTEHEDSIVRATTCYPMTSLPDEYTEQATEAEVRLLADENQDVRDKAAMYANYYDDRVLPGLEAILMNRDDHACHTSALRALKDIWYGFFGERHNAAAYALTLEYLKATPRDFNIPDWFGVSDLCMKQEDYQKWLADADYFDPDEFIEVLMAITEDPDAQTFTRGDAAEAAASIASDEQFAAIEARVSALTDDNAKSIQEDFAKVAAERG